MSRKYMLLKETSQKVYLTSNSEGVWEMTIGGKIYCMDESIEREMIYHVYGDNNRNEVIEWLRTITKKDLSPIQIDHAINDFVFLHKTENQRVYTFSEIPLCADYDRGMRLYIPGHTCTISLENERELMEMIRAKPYNEVLKDMEKWFERYCDRYALKYSKECNGKQYRYLVTSFLVQHGISRYGWPSIKTVPAIQGGEKEKYEAEQRKGCWIVLGIVLAFIACEVFGYLLVSVTLPSPYDSGLLELAINTIGGLLFLAPFIIIFHL